jgi:Asp-tRNA(Asn)/Glu-tRNA(Gln) amidotransferase A subunit family amidase
MRAMDQALKDVDVVITPSYAPRLLQYTNLTGHPAVVVPNGFRASDGTPTSISFIGKLFGDAKVLTVAKAWQDATDFHTKHPRRFT